MLKDQNQKKTRTLLFPDFKEIQKPFRHASAFFNHAHFDTHVSDCETFAIQASKVPRTPQSEVGYLVAEVYAHVFPC